MNKANQVLGLFNEESDKNVDITDYKEGCYKTGSRIGYVSIMFRDKKDKRPMFNATNNFFALNSYSDTWYRVPKEENVAASGYGLAIIDLKLTTKNGEYFNKDYVTYKAILNYIPSSHEDEVDAVKEPIWILVYKDITIDEVLDYIKQNSSKWRA